LKTLFWFSGLNVFISNNWFCQDQTSPSWNGCFDFYKVHYLTNLEEKQKYNCHETSSSTPFIRISLAYSARFFEFLNGLS